MVMLSFLGTVFHVVDRGILVFWLIFFSHPEHPLTDIPYPYGCKGHILFDSVTIKLIEFYL